MSCSSFASVTPPCTAIQIIEPDPTLPVLQVPPGGIDPSLNESGNVILTQNAGVVNVTFLTQKAGDYRFEYLYVDALGLSNPEFLGIVPVTQTIYGFTVDLSGLPIAAGYILRWHVVVISTTTTTGTLVDSPENLYVQLILQPPSPPIIPPWTQNITFVNPRSNTTYGFSELRVENLIDSPQNLVAVVVMVIAKTTLGFTVAANPRPNTSNYYLKVRTP